MTLRILAFFIAILTPVPCTRDHSWIICQRVFWGITAAVADAVERSRAGVFVFTRHFDVVFPRSTALSSLPVPHVFQRCCSTDITKPCLAIYMQSRDEEQDINWNDSQFTGRDLIGGCWLGVCSISLQKKKCRGEINITQGVRGHSHARFTRPRQRLETLEEVFNGDGR